MFRRLLVANRGEVAARITRTSRRLGIHTTVVCSEADARAAWTEEADAVVCIGGAHARDSYLDADAILEAARRHRCAALHPGWGFLSENAVFAARCEALGIRFIGPPAPVLHQLGDKLAARRWMQARGLPVIPGTHEPVRCLEHALREAATLGYPVLVKASAGGGGRGLRSARTPAEVEQALLEARAQAASAFGQEEVYLERLVEGGRHIEFQVLTDRYGGALCLGERECSIQRQRQKLLEEAPCPTVLTPAQRALGERAACAMAAAGYVGAGTVEMLLDRDDRLLFMECNARLQVEHGVTEAVTGLDLVEWQIRLAGGQPLPVAPEPQGHAIECRINAEDPERDFRPGPGPLARLELPHGPGIRVDTHLRRAGPGEQADRIPPHYDSLICKLIAHGASRRQALDRLAEALRETRISGVPTTLPLHRALLQHPDVQRGRYDTTFLEERFLPTWKPAHP